MQHLIFNGTKRYDPDPICTSTLTPPQSSGIDLNVKTFHIDVSLFVLTLTARRRNYLFKNFLLYLRCGGALLLSVANVRKIRYVAVYTK